MRTRFKLWSGLAQQGRRQHDQVELWRHTTPEVEQSPRWSWRSWKDWAALLLTIVGTIFYLYLFYHG